MIELRWVDFKSAMTTRGLYFQWYDFSDTYHLYMVDGPLQFHCKLYKYPDDTTDLVDFETSHKNGSLANVRLAQRDTDGAMIFRQKAAKTGWTYAAIPVEFSTSALSTSVYSKLADGTNRSGITLKLYDAENEEITTAGILNANLAQATKTVIDFEPAYDYEIIGGSLRTKSDITADLRLWIIGVPDIPAGSGGSKEMVGGINLNFLVPQNEYKVDGRVSKTLIYNSTYHTNKLRLIFTYPAGTTESISVVWEMYRA